MHRPIIVPIAVLVLSFFLAPWHGASAQSPSSTEVEFEAAVVAARQAEITPITNGWLNEITFKPGDRVSKGDVLFKFDKAPQQLRITRAEAELMRARATLRNAEQQLQRVKTLRQRDVSSEATLIATESARDVSAANVKDAEAALKLQLIGLDYLTLKAPLSGVISAPMVKENGWQDTTTNDITMAVITQLDPIRVVGLVPYVVYAKHRRLFAPGDEAVKGLTLALVLPDGSKYLHQGRIVSGGSSFDEKTQKIAVWAEFPNPEHFLRPGLKVTVRSYLTN